VIRVLGLSSGSATDITARLKRLRLLDEAGSPPTGERGRPSPMLVPHPDGPVVCAVDISHERWRISVAELGGGVVEQASGRHATRRPDAVLGHLRETVNGVYQRYPGRLGAVSVAVAGTVRGTDVVQAAGLRWRNVSLESLRIQPGMPLLVGNDATLAGLAEARRGAGARARVVLHLIVAVGVGGTLVVDGTPVDGTTGAGGEFGHLPFGDPGRSCPCGARGCWDLEVGGRAMARLLGEPPPRNPRTRAEQVIATAAVDPAARLAVQATARALGRGIGGLVNATDPDVVTLSGLAVEIMQSAPGELESGYRAALMRFHRSSPPALTTTTLGSHSQLTGAVDRGFDAVLTPDGLDAWSGRAVP
jgi:predicted NBD/HSP70 family sugar kinase